MAVREVLSWYDEEDVGIPYGMGSDLWSLGVLLYVILSGCSPFSAEQEEAILQLVAEAKYEFHESEWSTVSADAKAAFAMKTAVTTQAKVDQLEMSFKYFDTAIKYIQKSLAELRKTQLETVSLQAATADVEIDMANKGQILGLLAGLKKKGLLCLVDHHATYK